MPPSAAVLVVFPSGGALPILEGLERHNARVVSAENCTQARQVLRSDESIDLVITATSLADGNWYSVLESSVASGDRAALVVAKDDADPRLDDEVRCHGGLGVVLKKSNLKSLLKQIRKQRAAAAN